MEVFEGEERRNGLEIAMRDKGNTYLTYKDLRK